MRNCSVIQHEGILEISQCALHYSYCLRGYGINLVTVRDRWRILLSNSGELWRVESMVRIYWLSWYSSLLKWTCEWITKSVISLAFQACRANIICNSAWIRTKINNELRWSLYRSNLSLKCDMMYWVNLFFSFPRSQYR